MRPSGLFDVGYGDDMAIVRTKTQWGLLVLLIVFMCLVPWLPWIDVSWLTFINFTLITIIAVLGLNITTGLAGQVSIGHAAFVMIGAYTSGILTVKSGLPFIAALPLSAIIPAAIGAVVGIPSLRLFGFYLAIATLSFQFIAVYVVMHLTSITGGSNGLFGVGAPSVAGFAFDTDYKIFYLILAVLAGAIFVSVNLMRSRVGRAFVAVRDNWIAAEASGVSTYIYKVMAFSIGAAFAGVSGCLLVHYIGLIRPEQLTVFDSIWYLGMISIGGWASTVGVILGVTTLKLVEQLLTTNTPWFADNFTVINPESWASLTTMAFGVLIIGLILWQPRGLVFFVNMIKTYIRIWPFSY
jgi:branched-chain amino acid transport system permease protein